VLFLLCCRQAAVKALSAFRDKWGHQYKVYVPQGERLEYHEYVGLLKQSKIVISPWGWGEWSHKDFEILMAGCVVVKPRSDIFRIHPAIFEHNVTAITTKEDLSDLEEQILPFLRDVPRAQVGFCRALCCAHRIASHRIASPPGGIPRPVHAACGSLSLPCCQPSMPLPPPRPCNPPCRPWPRGCRACGASTLAPTSLHRIGTS
jgi:hypothetical protein